MSRSPFSRLKRGLLLWAVILALALVSFSVHLVRASAHRIEDGRVFQKVPKARWL